MAAYEFQVVADMLCMIIENCHKKRISTTFENGVLTANESTCLGTCIAKYFDTNLMVGEFMKRMSQWLNFATRF